MCGQPTVLYYAPILFEQLGFESNQSSTLAVVGAGVTKVSYEFHSHVGEKRIVDK